MLLLAVDPGIRACGCAVFRDGVLHNCAFVENESDNDRRRADPVFAASRMAGSVLRQFKAVDKVIVEFPRIYQRAAGKSKGDPNDLTPLCAVGGALAGVFIDTEVWSVAPSEWKGQATKEAMTTRILGRLSIYEQEILDERLSTVAKSLRHNVIDAVGIGLHALGRLERKRVIER